MLRIEYQIFMIDGGRRTIMAVINADSTAHWLSETMRLYKKIIITSVTYDERYD